MYVHPTFIYFFNSLPNDKIVDLLKVKTFPDNNIKVNEKTEIYRSKPHKTFLEKEKMLVTTIFFFFFFFFFLFSLFQQWFPNGFFLGVVKRGDSVVER